MTTRSSPRRFGTPTARWPTSSVRIAGRPCCGISEWMKEYGIDGAFVQRFAVSTLRPESLNHCNTVLAHCREGANRYGRTYAVMYDLSGLRAGQVQQVIDDWKLLVDRMRIGRDKGDRAYLHHRGKPVVAVWGIGFNDGRKYSLEECERLVRFLKQDPQYGGSTVMVGVPTGWRTLDRDSVPDERSARDHPAGRHHQPVDGRPVRFADRPSPGTPRSGGNPTSSGASSMARSICRWSSPALAGTT